MEKIKLFQTAFDKGMSYSEYRNLINRLLEMNQATGENHSQAMLGHTKMNVQRMKRLDKTWSPPADLEAKLSSITQEEKWLVITEGWCGDAAQTVPLMNHLAALNPNIEMRLVLRDEHLDLMSYFLTEGGKSIPILMRWRSGNALTHWGPRPAFAQEMLRAYKNNPGMSYEAFSTNLHSWYAKDKGLSFSTEILAWLSN
jgi:hypothetical protein